MKIINGNVVYAQKNDIVFLTEVDSKIPASVFFKVFSSSIVVINDKNRYDFVRFEEENSVEYLKKTDLILNYDDIKNLSLEEIKNICSNLSNELNSIAMRYNLMNLDTKKENQNLVKQHEILQFKLYCLRDYLKYREGDLNMDIPEHIKSNEDNKGIKKLIKTFLKK